ncbi:MAG: multicopper oxidase domain-containing protein [Methylococcales bacterium]|nr:multicopper oxidase domain-containing protein [Methylococcales bacterium]
MLKQLPFYLSLVLLPIALLVAFNQVPDFSERPSADIPATIAPQVASSGTEAPCPDAKPEWRSAQTIDGVAIAASPLCQPDNPYLVAASVKGINNVSMHTLMQTNLAEDSLVKGADLDGDGDPDVIDIKLEVVELNGASPDSEALINTFAVAPGIQPGLWVYAPKSRGMALKHFNTLEANDLLRAPSPVLRVEQGDRVRITLENTHYLPHTIHLHGVDHPWQTAAGLDNDGMETHAVMPGGSHAYEFTARHAGTMLYHCHVQTAQHLMMGLKGLIIIEENRPDNWLQTFNVGAGQVRHPAQAVLEQHTQEYDLHFQSIDLALSGIIQRYTDPRLIARDMNRRYNMTESHENLFLLNGHAFPYTLRDGSIVAEANQAIKLRVLNGHRSLMGLHIHGHKPTITAYDGVTLSKNQQLTRDTIDLAPAQRVDLTLSTVNDGLHSYGPGAWMLHDHVETATTSNGMEPGGNMAMLIYQDFLDDQGLPKHHETLFDQVFNIHYYAKKLPVWGHDTFAVTLGEPGNAQPDWPKLLLFGFSVGLSVTCLLFLLRYRPENNA